LIPEEWELRKLVTVIETFEAGVSVNAEDRPKAETEFGV